MSPLPDLLPAATLAVVLRRSRLQVDYLSGVSGASAHERSCASYSVGPAVVVDLCGAGDDHRFSHPFGSICLATEVAIEARLLFDGEPKRANIRKLILNVLVRIRQEP